MTPNFAEQAAQFIMSDEFNGKGPCLIPKPGREVPSCHENDFCECDMNKAFLAGGEHGYRVGIKTCDCHGDETGRTAYKCVFHSEIDQLKARLERATSLIKSAYGYVKAHEHEGLTNALLNDMDRFTQHPQDGAKGDL